MAADVIHEALVDADVTALQRYPKLLDDEYGQYFKVARLFARVIGRPALMRELTRAGMHSRTLMEWVLRIMANLLRPEEIGPAEAAYKAAAALVRLAPNSADRGSAACASRPAEAFAPAPALARARGHASTGRLGRDDR